MRNPARPAIRRVARPVIRRVVRRVRSMRGILTVGKYQAQRDLAPLGPDEQATVDAFHRLTYDAWQPGKPDDRGTISLSWFGYRTLKSPLDLWTYQEIIVETRPDLIIECGTKFGGSAYYLASILDLLGHGRVLTVDIEQRTGRPVHRRIEYVLGSSTDPAVVARVREAARGQRVMVLLDSDHSQSHVAGELEAYHDLVAPGCYLVVEDTNVNGHPAMPEHGPGPMEALDAFMEGRSDFIIDRDRERFLLTLNPRGFLRRVG